MSRKILFKEKRIDNAEWVEGYLFGDGIINSNRMFIGELTIEDYKGNADDGPTIITGSYYSEVDPGTVCQYTGLMDKNGRKIFENDICKGTFLPTERLTRKFRISYTSLQCRFSAVDLDRGIAEPVGAYINYNYKTEVIGNIFDGGFDGKESEKSVTKQPKTDKWILYIDRLPPEPPKVAQTKEELEEMISNGTLQEYLVTLNAGGRVTTLYYVGDSYWYDQGKELLLVAIAWQPLPEPYKLNNQAAVQEGDNP